MSLHEPIRELPEPGQLYRNARAQQVENDRQALQRAKAHRTNIPPGNALALKSQDQTIARLQKIVDEEWLHV